jgi:hypothetical protein
VPQLATVVNLASLTSTTASNHIVVHPCVQLVAQNTIVVPCSASPCHRRCSSLVDSRLASRVCATALGGGGGGGGGGVSSPNTPPPPPPPELPYHDLACTLIPKLKSQQSLYPSLCSPSMMVCRKVEDSIFSSYPFRLRVTDDIFYLKICIQYLSKLNNILLLC